MTLRRNTNFDANCGCQVKVGLHDICVTASAPTADCVDDSQISCQTAIITFLLFLEHEALNARHLYITVFDRAVTFYSQFKLQFECGKDKIFDL